MIFLIQVNNFIDNLFLLLIGWIYGCGRPIHKTGFP